MDATEGPAPPFPTRADGEYHHVEEAVDDPFGEYRVGARFRRRTGTAPRVKFVLLRGGRSRLTGRFTRRGTPGCHIAVSSVTGFTVETALRKAAPRRRSATSPKISARVSGSARTMSASVRTIPATDNSLVPASGANRACRTASRSRYKIPRRDTRPELG